MWAEEPPRSQSARASGFGQGLAAVGLAALCAVLWATLAAFPGLLRAQGTGAPLRVCIVHSYHPGYSWTQEINKGVYEALGGLNVSYSVLYLDAKRQHELQRLQLAGRDMARTIAEMEPDAVVAADDAVQEYVISPHLKGGITPQVIFCGVNGPPDRYGYPAANVSGVRERFHFREGVALAKRILPQAANIAYLFDASETSLFLRQDMARDVAEGGPFALTQQSLNCAVTFQQWQRRVLDLQSQADVLGMALYHSLKDEQTGEAVPAAEVAEWTRTVNTKPTLGFADFSVDHHVLCGVLESGFEQGFLAGQMVREVLVGRIAAGALPMRVNESGMVMVNLKTAENLGLDIPYDVIEAASVVVH
ncbi:ABC transporter substrate-binding protein [Fundidesulfovibrio soli]|uniref:ABC transporter substrate-binding protein n=1 Tax=Fundidesulfovibrio soli TaxID=2922716 RepID=UPI001FB03967|nr:ABC transporter substrate binding protein [Fundidesulfovibrio soli]